MCTASLILLAALFANRDAWTGKAEFFAVEHVKLGVRYALKTFTLEDGNAALFRQRFLAEGKVLARLSHPNIARVFDLNYDEDKNGPSIDRTQSHLVIGPNLMSEWKAKHKK